MHFLKNLLQRPSLGRSRNNPQKSSASPDSTMAQPQPQQTVQAIAKSARLTPDQLTEALRGLSRY